MKNNNSKKLFVFGLGYVATALAVDLKAKGWTVAGTCRSRERQNLLWAKGIESCIFDGKKPGNAVGRAIADANFILCSIPPDSTGDPVLAFHEEQIRNAKEVEWIGYLSTTGVYGNWDGRQVDEESALLAISDRAQRRIHAEGAWLQIGQATGQNVQIFRLAGIYGPHRNVIVKIRSGKARRIHKEGHVFSRIHLKDINATLCLSMNQPIKNEIYNVCDDEPAAQEDVVSFACKLLGVSAPGLTAFTDAAESMSPIAKSFWADSRRVSNKKIKTKLKVVLSYPTYREGLQSLI